MHFRKRLAVSFQQIKRLNRALKRPQQLSDFPLVSTEKLRFADTDRNGHVSNAVFAVCCQNARMELLSDAAGAPVPPEAQFVLGRLDLTFRREMHWPGTVHVGTRVDRIEACSVLLAQALFVNDRCVAIAKSTVVMISKDTRRPVPMPNELIAYLAAYGPPHPWPADMLGSARRVIGTLSVRA